MGRPIQMDIQGVIARVSRASEKALLRVGLKVERAAKRSMKGGKQGKGKNRVSVASPPGTPPNVQTGNLRASITTASDDVTASVVVGAVARYGKIHETGGTEHVPAHTAHVKAHTRKGKSKGKPVQVQAHTRNVPAHTAHYPARPFMAPALQAVHNQIAEEFKGAMNK